MSVADYPDVADGEDQDTSNPATAFALYALGDQESGVNSLGDYDFTAHNTSVADGASVGSLTAGPPTLDYQPTAVHSEHAAHTQSRISGTMRRFGYAAAAVLLLAATVVARYLPQRQGEADPNNNQARNTAPVDPAAASNNNDPSGSRGEGDGQESVQGTLQVAAAAAAAGTDISNGGGSGTDGNAETSGGDATKVDAVEGPPDLSKRDAAIELAKKFPLDTNDVDGRTTMNGPPLDLSNPGDTMAPLPQGPDGSLGWAIKVDLQSTKGQIMPSSGLYYVSPNGDIFVFVENKCFWRGVAQPDGTFKWIVLDYMRQYDDDYREPFGIGIDGMNSFMAGLPSGCINDSNFNRFRGKVLDGNKGGTMSRLYNSTKKPIQQQETRPKPSGNPNDEIVRFPGA